MGNRNNPAVTCDTDKIVHALRLILVPGQVTEIRALNAITSADRRPHTESGYFDDLGALAGAVQGIKSATGIYFVPNPIKPELLSRAANRIRPVWREPTTADHDIASRQWLLVDIDPVRPAGISSTDQEHQHAIELAITVCRELAKEGWPWPILADSGNGAHPLYRVALPAQDDGLIQRCLEALASRFDTANLKIDTSVHNPARIWKVYGTWACKGDSTPERPHRLAHIIKAPDQIEVVPQELLEVLAASVSKPAIASDTCIANAGGFDIDTWINRHGLDVIGPTPWQGGRRWVFKVCPWNQDHTNRSAFIVQQENGAVGAGCHHNGCAGKGWHDLRDVVEPEWRERKHRGNDRDSAASSGQRFSWSDPQPLPQELPPVAAFEFSLLPDSFRPWITDIADRMQCPPDFPAVAAMVAHAAVVGRKIGIRPKRRDDWLVVPNLWGAVIGRPGILKTPAVQEPLKPLKRLEIEAKEQFDAELTQYDAAKIVATQRRKLKEGEIKKALKDGDDALEIAASMLSEEGTAPVRKRYLVNDSTVEKLGELLNQNPNGFLSFRDELTGLLRSLDKEGQEGARSFYLEAWNGTGRYTYDRIGRGTIDIEAAIVSVLGGIQPGPLENYLRAALNNGVGDDGLLQRFQLSVYPDVSGEWRNVDQWPDSAAKNRGYEVFTRLNNLNPDDVDAQRDDKDDAIPYLRFTDHAQDIFDDWRENLERRLRSGDEHPAMESHLAKYRSLIPSLALLIHLADDNTGPVGVQALETAIRWGEYLESHARRIYAIAINPDVTAAKALARRIVDGALKDGFALRDVYRPGWSNLSTRDDALRAVNMLLDLGWLLETKEATGGAPRTQYWINPQVCESLEDSTDKTDKSQSQMDMSVLSIADEGGTDISATPEGDEIDDINRLFDEVVDVELETEIVEWSR